MTQEVPEPIENEVPEPAESQAPEPPQKCANCGAELRPNDRYCGECGLPTFVPASAEAPKAPPAPPAKPQTALPPPAAPAPASSAKSGTGTWAIVTGVILLLVGAAACAIGVVAMLSVSWIATAEDAPYFLGGTGLCCVLPAVLVMIAGGVVWYVWGRKKA